MFIKQTEEKEMAPIGPPTPPAPAEPEDSQSKADEADEAGRASAGRSVRLPQSVRIRPWDLGKEGVPKVQGMAFSVRTFIYFFISQVAVCYFKNE